MIRQILTHLGLPTEVPKERSEPSKKKHDGVSDGEIRLFQKDFIREQCCFRRRLLVKPLGSPARH